MRDRSDATPAGSAGILPARSSVCVARGREDAGTPGNGQ